MRPDQRMLNGKVVLAVVVRLVHGRIAIACRKPAWVCEAAFAVRLGGRLPRLNWQELPDPAGRFHAPTAASS